MGPPPPAPPPPPPPQQYYPVICYYCKRFKGRVLSGRLKVGGWIPNCNAIPVPHSTTVLCGTWVGFLERSGCLSGYPADFQENGFRFDICIIIQS